MYTKKYYLNSNDRQFIVVVLTKIDSNLVGPKYHKTKTVTHNPNKLVLLKLIQKTNTSSKTQNIKLYTKPGQPLKRKKRKVYFVTKYSLWKTNRTKTSSGQWFVPNLHSKYVKITYSILLIDKANKIQTQNTYNSITNNPIKMYQRKCLSQTKLIFAAHTNTQT